MNVYSGVACICSRGLVHSRTVESVTGNLTSAPGTWRLTCTHNLPIPTAQNQVVQQALDYHPTWIWFVEEDVVPPKYALKHLLNLSIDKRVPVVSGTYRLRGGLWSHQKLGEQATFAGMGCLLVKAKLFDLLPKPWFRSDKAYDLKLDNVGTTDSYGQQDIHFFAALKKCGFKWHLAEDLVCRHLYVAEQGKFDNNNGCHVIKEH